MSTELFAISEYCIVHKLDPAFIDSLEEEGLIILIRKNEDRFVEEEQLQVLETFTRWHVEMGINPQGIDALRNILEKLKSIHYELDMLRSRLKLYED